MTHTLPPHTPMDPDKSQEYVEEHTEMADLRVFWGPEICRLEYLVHLLETGRVKDENWPRSA